MTRTIAAVVIVSIGLTMQATADVRDFKVFAESTIVQRRNGVQEARQQVSKGFPATENVTPVEAITALPVANVSSGRLWGGLNRVVANAPQFNADLPTDFVLDMSAGSAETDVSLQLTAEARQMRTINVLASELDPPINSNTPVTLQSTFLLDGSLAAVVPKTAGSAEGLNVELTVQLKKDDSERFRGTVALLGQPDGTVEAVSEHFQADDFHAGVLDVPGLGAIHVLSFNAHEIPYDYVGQIGETFDLEALITVDLTVPGGLAGGANFGTVPAEVILLSQELFGDSIGPVAAAAVPEPASFVLLLAAAGLAMTRAKSKR